MRERDRMDKFYGRKRELNILKELLDKRSASLVVLRGRRRIGKSRLAEEFSRFFTRSFTFVGLPPEKGITAIFGHLKPLFDPFWGSHINISYITPQKRIKKRPK